MDELITALSSIRPHDEVRLTLLNGDTLEGTVNPVDYAPEDCFRLELFVDGEKDTRYDVRCKYAHEEWETPRVRRYRAGVEQGEWADTGQLGDVTITHRFEQSEYQSNIHI